MTEEYNDIYNDEFDADELNATVVLSKATGDSDEIDFEISKEIETSDYKDRFRFICYFAAGGMGQVGKAKDLAFDRVVAVKTLKDKYKDNSRVVKSFLEECRLNAQLDHPSIVPIYAMGKGEHGNWEVIMKLINGTSLSNFIKTAREVYTNKRITYRQEQRALISRLEYFLKICEAINYCHSRKVVHGDLKPDNIMMGQYGEVYIMDWGCARYADTSPDHISGTPNYLPPEFLIDKKVTFQIDVYSLGIILFELVTLLRAKATNSTRTHQTTNITRHNVFDLDKWHFQPGMKVNHSLKAIIFKAINPDPNHRYKTVNELALDIRHFIYDEEVSADPDGLLKRFVRTLYHNRLKSIIIVSLTFIVLLCLLFQSYYQANRKEKIRQASLTQMVRLQSTTDELANEVSNNFLLGQTQVMMYADLIIENIDAHPAAKDQKFYSNNLYKKAETSPPGMIETDVYPNPINLQHLAYIPSIQASTAEDAKLMDETQFLRICRKVISSNFESRDIVHEDNRLFTTTSLIQRLMIVWKNGVGFVYPGGYDDPNTFAFYERWNNPDNRNTGNRIIWSQPYIGNTGRQRIVCRYPMRKENKEFIGVAGVEMRLESILYPIMKAHKANPDLRFYFVDLRGNRAGLVTGDEIIMPHEDGFYPDRTHVSEIFAAAARLKDSEYQQFESTIGGKQFFITGSIFKVVDSVFIQMIDAESMTRRIMETPKK